MGRVVRKDALAQHHLFAALRDDAQSRLVQGVQRLGRLRDADGAEPRDRGGVDAVACGVSINQAS